jgi:CRISPR-associated protein Cas2
MFDRPAAAFRSGLSLLRQVTNDQFMKLLRHSRIHDWLLLIADAKRLRLVYKTMCGHGDPLQYSVFRCELSDMELQKLKDVLWPIVNLEEDRVMIVDLGPAAGRGDECVEFWGAPRVEPPDRTAAIV